MLVVTQEKSTKKRHKLDTAYTKIGEKNTLVSRTVHLLAVCSGLVVHILKLTFFISRPIFTSFSMITPASVIKFIIAVILSVVYSSWVGFGLLLGYIFKRDLFDVKERQKPAPLSSSEYGTHKFANVNVSYLVIDFRGFDC